MAKTSRQTAGGRKTDSLRTLVSSLPLHGGRTAIAAVQGENVVSISYADLGEQAQALAFALKAEGLSAGDHVLLFGPNSIDWAVVRLALGYLGAITVALDDLSSDAELDVLIPDSEASAAFVADAHVSRVEAVLHGKELSFPLYRLDGGRERQDAPPHWQELQGSADSELPPVNPDDPQMLVYTSGTTGTPKSFYLSHANLLHNIHALLEQQVVTPRDRVLLPLPLHHVYPLTIGLLTALSGGSTLVLPEGVSGQQILTALRVGRVSAVVGVPKLYAALYSGIRSRVESAGLPARLLFRLLFVLSYAMRRYAGLRLGRFLFRGLHRRLAPNLWLLASGGARFEPGLIWNLEALGWDTRSGWGLAETSSILTNNGGGRDKKIGTEGRVLTGMELRVADPDAQRIGELQARGPALFRGYRNNEAVNAEAFTEDGWFRTGDLGHVDRKGFVTIHGRVKEMIVLGGGKNVFPEEIEKVYAEHPAIEEIAVLEQNDALVALVVPNQTEIGRGNNLQIEQVIRIALSEQGQALATYQRPTGFAISRSALPRTRLGKYQRFKLPELYRQAKAGTAVRSEEELDEADQALLNSPPAGEIFSYIKARYADRPVDLDSSLQLDLGIDSLEWVTLALELERRFGFALPYEEATQINSLRELLQKSLEEASGSGMGDVQREMIAPLSEEEARWLEPRRTYERVLGATFYAIDWLLMRGIFRLTVRGEEHLPPVGQKPTIYIANHVSDLDPLALAPALGYRRLSHAWWSGDQGRLFDSGAGRLLARATRIFPVDERRPTSALSFALEVLDRGESVIWFPESWRSPDGELQKFLPGIGHLVLNAPAQVQVVPARLAGTFEALPRTRRWPRPKALRVTFGTPIAKDRLAQAETPAEMAELLRGEMAILPKKRR
ncbi:AMP-binding protein [Fodinicurvata halophila]|uniref:AMP-binding protein n=1 Tax=Fodinicurvata halophila TaxID=1419723 RepID=A0ABV8UM85_9PROT